MEKFEQQIHNNTNIDMNNKWTGRVERKKIQLDPPHLMAIPLRRTSVRAIHYYKKPLRSRLKTPYDVASEAIP